MEVNVVVVGMMVVVELVELVVVMVVELVELLVVVVVVEFVVDGGGDGSMSDNIMNMHRLF